MRFAHEHEVNHVHNLTLSNEERHTVPTVLSECMCAEPKTTYLW